MNAATRTGAQAIIDGLQQQGVEYIFGYPGGANMPIFDALLDSSLKLILVRHEQGATHMADGYARATGKPGVVFVTSGPGALAYLAMNTEREGLKDLKDLKNSGR